MEAARSGWERNVAAASPSSRVVEVSGTTGSAQDAGILAEARDGYRWKVTAPTKVVVGRTASRSSTRVQGAGPVVTEGP